MPRLRARRPSLPSPRIRTSRRMRVRDRWSRGRTRARRQRYRRLGRRGFRACRRRPTCCQSRPVARYQPSCVDTRRRSGLSRRPPPATPRLGAASAPAAAATATSQAFDGATFASRPASAACKCAGSPPPQPATPAASKTELTAIDAETVTTRTTFEPCHRTPRATTAGIQPFYDGPASGPISKVAPTRQPAERDTGQP